MDIVVTKYANYAFLQFDEDINDCKVILQNTKGKTIKQYYLKNKNFLLIDNLRANERYIVEVKNAHNELIANKKI
jgi:hypothetical protein